MKYLTWIYDLNRGIDEVGHRQLNGDFTLKTPGVIVEADSSEAAIVARMARPILNLRFTRKNQNLDEIERDNAHWQANLAGTIGCAACRLEAQHYWD